jgi:hypothetical protein
MDIAPGFSGSFLSEEDYKERFKDCLDFAKKPIGRERAMKIFSFKRDLEKIDVDCRFVELLLG